jgi:AcrR family transcriptional regulator
MERYGYKKMTIDDIAHEAGIGKATIYGYFEKKQDVALAVVDGYHARVQARWREIVEQDKSPDVALREMLVGRVMYAFDNASRYRQSLDESLAALRTLVLSRRGRYNEEDTQIVESVIIEGNRRGIFCVGGTSEVAAAMITCTSGLMPYSLSSTELTQRDEVERMTHQVVSLMLQGLYRRVETDL